MWLWWNGGNVTELHSTGDVLVSHRPPDRPSRRVLGAPAGAAARADPVGRAYRRARPAHRLAPLERPRLPLPRPRSRRLLGLGLCRARPAAADDGDLADAHRRHLPGDDHGHGRDGPARAVVVSSVVVVRRRVRYEAWYAIHLTVYLAIALAWFHQIPTGNELVARRGRRRLVARPLSRDAGPARRLPRRRARRQRLPVPAPRGRGRRRGSRRRVAAPRGPRARPPRRDGRAVLPLALPHPRPLVGVAPFSLSAAPDGRSLRITIKELGDFTARAGAIPVGNPRRRGGAVRRLHRRCPAAPRRWR